MLIFETFENATITRLGMYVDALIENTKKNIGLVTVIDKPGMHVVRIPIETYDIHSFLELDMKHKSLYCENISFSLRGVRYLISESSKKSDELIHLIRFIEGIASILINHEKREINSNQK